MKIEVFTVGAFAMNCYLLIDTDTGDAIYIDPGAEADMLIDKVLHSGVTLRYIINTHCHIDHAAEDSVVQKRWPCVAAFLAELRDVSSHYRTPAVNGPICPPKRANRLCLPT